VGLERRLIFLEGQHTKTAKRRSVPLNKAYQRDPDPAAIAPTIGFFGPMRSRSVCRRASMGVLSTIVETAHHHQTTTAAASNVNPSAMER
jgi:hypothetical protein